MEINQNQSNGKMGTIKQIIFAQNQRPPMLPIAVIVQFHRDDYIGSSFVKICQIKCLFFQYNLIQNNDTYRVNLERQQLLLILAWSIHKSQGLTLKITVGTPRSF